MRLFFKRILRVFFFFNVILQLWNINNDLKFGEQSKLLKEKLRASTVEERMVIISVITACIRICFFFHIFYNRLIDYFNARKLPMETMFMVDI